MALKEGSIVNESNETKLRAALQNLHERTKHMYGRAFPDMSKAIDDAAAALSAPSTETSGDQAPGDAEVAALARQHAVESNARDILARWGALQPAKRCDGCGGEGLVGGLRSDDYHSDECPFCKGSGVVDDGEIPGVGGVAFENGPVKCVKDCPAGCAAPRLVERKAQPVSDNGSVAFIPKVRDQRADGTWGPWHTLWDRLTPYKDVATRDFHEYGDESIIVELFDRPQSVAPAADAAVVAVPATFQQRHRPAAIAAFGKAHMADIASVAGHLIEEAAETVQAAGLPEADALLRVRYVYSRPVGELSKEIGSVMSTLAGLANAVGVDMHRQAEADLVHILRPEVSAGMPARYAAKIAALAEFAAAPSNPSQATGDSVRVEGDSHA